VVAFTDGVTHASWRSSPTPGTTSYSDEFTVSNVSAPPGAFDVALTYLAVSTV
jgi:hypothetical protein